MSDLLDRLCAARLLSSELPGEGIEERLAPRIATAQDWLACQGHQKLFLLAQRALERKVF